MIVVDNDSSDDSKEILGGDKRIVYVQSDLNVGFGKANNLGFKHSSGRYVFFLNSDTLLINNAITSLYYVINEADDEVGCVGSLLLDRNNNVVHSYGKFPHWYDELIGRQPESNYANDYPAIVETISGADLMIRRSVIEKYGLFDPEFFMYYEDTELLYRYKKNKVKAIIADVRGIIHLEGGSSKVSSKKSIMQCYGFFKYIEKTNSKGIFAIKLILSTKRICLGVFKPWPISERFAYMKHLLLLLLN